MKEKETNENRYDLLLQHVDPFAFYDPFYISTAYDLCDDDATKIKLTM